VRGRAHPALRFRDHDLQPAAGADHDCASSGASVKSRRRTVLLSILTSSQNRLSFRQIPPRGKKPRKARVPARNGARTGGAFTAGIRTGATNAPGRCFRARRARFGARPIPASCAPARAIPYETAPKVRCRCTCAARGLSSVSSSFPPGSGGPAIEAFHAPRTAGAADRRSRVELPRGITRDFAFGNFGDTAAIPCAHRSAAPATVTGRKAARGGTGRGKTMVE